MYIPDWHWFILVIPILAMFYLFNNYGHGLDIWFVNMTLASITTFRALYLLGANLLYQMYMTLDHGKPSVVSNAQPDAETRKRTLIDLNKAVYEFKTQSVKIDARKHFAITLWRQLEYHGHDASKLDLTEDYWLKTKPKKWKGRNEEFRDCMHDWDGAVFQKSDPTRSNSRYVLRDEMELKRKADGRM